MLVTTTIQKRKVVVRSQEGMKQVDDVRMKGVVIKCDGCTKGRGGKNGGSD